MKKLFLTTSILLITACQTQQQTNSTIVELDYQQQDLSLEKVVILSRHGIRAPFVAHDSILAKSTPFTWPQWQTKGGYLTPKGARLEQLFADYLVDWLQDQQLLDRNQCPDQEILIYTNSLPRTIDSGQSFAKGAFNSCNLAVYHLEEIGKMDNTFNPITRSETNENFLQQANQAVDALIGKGGFKQLNQKLSSNFTTLEQVLDYSESPSCIENKQCTFSNQVNTLTFEQGKEPKTTGALRNGTGAVDSFMLQYYEGYPLQDVAWGRIKTAEQWQQLNQIKDTYNDVLFGTKVMAKQAATPLLTFIQNSFSDHDYAHPLIKQAQQAKLVVLFGHDSNVGSIIPLLRIKDYQLPQQYEKTPISGKIVFQQWKKPNGKSLMKIEYIYQTTEQLRNGSNLDATNPPQRVFLEMEDCPIDVNGFCSMDNFEQAVVKLLR